MFINVVEKSKSLFKDFSVVDSTMDSKKQAAANPIFSWHVKHIAYRRKKIVIFTNDASTLTVVLYDINAKNRALLEQRFQERLAELWSSLNIPEEDLNQYLKVAGPWQIGLTVNRNQLGRLNEVSYFTEMYLSDGVEDELFLSSKMTRTLRDSGSSKKASFAGDIPSIMRPNNFKWNEIKLEENSVDIEKLKRICNDLKQQERFRKEDFFFEDLDRTDEVVQQMVKLNDELLDIFIEGIKDEYSEKTIKSYKNALLIYLNQFLAFRLISVFNYGASSVDQMYIHGSSMTQTKQVQRSMSKLYSFLSGNGVMNVEFAKSMKRDMRNSIESLDYLDY